MSVLDELLDYIDPGIDGIKEARAELELLRSERELYKEAV